MEILTLIHILITVTIVTSTQTKRSRDRLELASSVELKLLNAYLRGKGLGDIQDKSGSYAKNLRITDVDLPKVSFSPTRGGFLVSASNIGLSVKGDFRIVYNIIDWIWISSTYQESGSFRATIRKVAFKIPISYHRRRFLRADRNKCWESTGTIRLRFNAKLIGWILNRFSGTIGGKLEKKISGKICDAVTKTINTSAAKLSHILKG